MRVNNLRTKTTQFELILNIFFLHSFESSSLNSTLYALNANMICNSLFSDDVL